MNQKKKLLKQKVKKFMGKNKKLIEKRIIKKYLEIIYKNK